MSLKAMARRLETLEAEASRKHRAWLHALTDEELEAHIAMLPPDPKLHAAVQALSDEDLELALAGKISDEELRRMYETCMLEKEKS